MQQYWSDPSGWSFADPPETEVITLDRILDGRSQILLVAHDDEEGSWQFLDGGQVFEDEGVIVLLGEIVQFDPSLHEIADLGRGEHAQRAAIDSPWIRLEGDPE